MGAPKIQLSNSQPLWQSYRDAFRDFQREAARLADLNSQPKPNTTATESALERLEHARLAYNDVRDSLAASRMSSRDAQLFWTVPGSTRQRREHVKTIAELLWQLSGRPQGSAEDDWYRAERVIRRAEACCAR
jgi:hypothetical protein